MVIKKYIPNFENPKKQQIWQAHDSLISDQVKRGLGTEATNCPRGTLKELERIC